ncbi:MAG: SpoVR family protein [Pseudomonadota bacterium]
MANEATPKSEKPKRKPRKAPKAKPAAPALKSAQPLFETSDWSFDLLRSAYDAIEEIAIGELGLDVYPNQIEVITSEQMLDAYASIGMPLLYKHWSFGKRFARDETLYRKGAQSLAYELVINSDPCICYVMEENSITMQTLVMAHAAFGHNHFFKNNYLFKQWTRADAVLDYLDFAKRYVAKCEERHGLEAVERTLDCAHALMSNGVNRYAAPRRLSDARKRERALERLSYEEATYDDLWRTLPTSDAPAEADDEHARDTRLEAEDLGLPEENLLYFLEKNAPKLADWQRELLRIVRYLAQYFYPQRQTKVMNEGCATFVHYEIMNRLFEKGLIGEGAMLEFLHSHSSVVFQPGFDDRRFGGLNPYALGFAMMRDLQRICDEPTEEDGEWFRDIAGGGDAYGVLREAWADYRDESFIHQFLSPTVMRDFRLFRIADDAEDPEMEVSAIHDERGYRELRKTLARQYDVGSQDPRLEVVEANLSGNRRLVVNHAVRDGRLLDKTEAENTLQYLADLWGHRVKMLETDVEDGDVLVEHDALPRPR